MANGGSLTMSIWVPKLILHKMQIIINLLFFTRSRVGIFEWVDYEKERKGLTGSFNLKVSAQVPRFKVNKHKK